MSHSPVSERVEDEPVSHSPISERVEDELVSHSPCLRGWRKSACRQRPLTRRCRPLTRRPQPLTRSMLVPSKLRRVGPCTYVVLQGSQNEGFLWSRGHVLLHVEKSAGRKLELAGESTDT
ncbi:hypothetical protein ACQJBY_005897 [Aegilops geniculata]